MLNRRLNVLSWWLNVLNWRLNVLNWWLNMLNWLYRLRDGCRRTSRCGVGGNLGFN